LPCPWKREGFPTPQSMWFGGGFAKVEAHCMVDWKENGAAKTKAAKSAARKEKQVVKAKRSMGKRQKALNDKILKINKRMENQQPNTNTNSGGTCDAIAMFTQQLGGVVTQFSVNEWNSKDRIACLCHQAQIKFLE